MTLAFSRVRLLHLVCCFVLTVGLVATAASPALALSLSDYFSYTYSAQFSKTEVAVSEPFTVTVTGQATCTRDLPLPVSEAIMTGRIVAQHQASGTRVTLNPSYVMTLSPAPSRAGETAQVSRVLTLQFPADSQPGSYQVIGELIKGEVRALITVDVTQYLPQTQTLGSVSVTAASGGGSPGGGPGGATPVPQATNVPQAGATTPPGDISRFLNDGVFAVALTVQSQDGSVKLAIATGTRARSGDGGEVTSITMTAGKAAGEPPLNASFAGPVYELGPAGTTFEPPARLSLPYEPQRIPQGIDASALAIAYWDAGTQVWKRLESAVDTGTQTVGAPVGHFTQFAVLAYSAESPFKLSDLSIVPFEVNAGAPVTVSALVANTGDLTGEYKAALEINGQGVETKAVTLSAGQKQKVSFSVSRDAAGTYKVAIGSLAATFTVKAAAPAPPPEKPLPRPAAFTMQDLTISPGEPKIGERVSVSVLVNNTGDMPGAYRVTFRLEDVVVETAEVTLVAGERRLVLFATSPQAAGRYSVAVNDLAGSFAVGDPSQSPADPRPSYLPIAVAVAIIIVAGLVVLRSALRRPAR